MSSQTTVVTTQPKAGASSARKKRITKYVANKRMSRASTFSVARSTARSDVLRLPAGFRQTVMPERYVTNLVSSLQYYIPASSIDAVNGNYQSIRVNSLISPFNTTYQAGSVSPTFSMNGTYVQGYSSGTNAIGTTVLSSIYSKYKVLGYKIRFSIMTSTNGDLLEACSFPCGNDEIPTTSTSGVNMSVYKGQPKSTSKLVHNGGPNAIIWQKGSVHELLGMRKQQWLDLDGTLTTGGTIQNPGYVGFYLQSLNGGTNNQTVVVDIKLVQIVEFTDIKNSVLVN